MTRRHSVTRPGPGTDRSDIAGLVRTMVGIQGQLDRLSRHLPRFAQERPDDGDLSDGPALSQ